MSWEDLMTHILTTTTNVEKIIVSDSRGRPLAVTDGVETSESECSALAKCLNDPAKNLTKIVIDGAEYICIQGIDHTMIATCYLDASRILVAHQELPEGNIVVLIGNREDANGSFISVVKRALLLKAQGQLLNPERMLQQQQQLLPVVPPQGFTPATTGGGGVLVDI